MSASIGIIDVIIFSGVSTVLAVCRCGYGGLCLLSPDYTNPQKTYLYTDCFCNEISKGIYSTDQFNKTCQNPILQCDQPNTCGSSSCVSTLTHYWCIGKDKEKKKPMAGMMRASHQEAPRLGVLFHPGDTAWGKEITIYIDDINSLRTFQVRIGDGRRWAFLRNDFKESDVNAICAEEAKLKDLDPRICYPPFTPKVKHSVKFRYDVPIVIDGNNIIKVPRPIFPNEIVGRHDVLSIKGFNEKNESTMMEKKFPMFSAYPQFFKYSRNIKLEGCSAIRSRRIYYLEGTSFSIKVSFSNHFEVDDKYQVSDIEWYLAWANFAQGRNKIETEFKAESDYAGQDLVITVKVWLVGDVEYYGGQNKEYQIGYCYINVTPTPVVLIVEGGNRTLDCGTEAHLSLKTENPSHSLGKMQIQWKCVNCDISCRGELNELMCAGCYVKCFLSAETLYPHCSSEIEFFISVQEPFFKRAGNTTVKLKVRRDSGSVKLTCKPTCVKPNPSRSLVIEAETPHSCQVKWTIKESYAPNQDTSEFRIPGTNENTFAIQMGALKASTEYSVSAACSTNNGFGSVIIVTGEPPLGGTCLIHPNEGIAGVTKFNLSCSGWKTEFGPLKYEIYQERNRNELEMFDWNYYPKFTDCLFTEDRLTVRISDYKSMYTDFSLRIDTLSDCGANRSDCGWMGVEELIRKQHMNLDKYDHAGTIDLVNAVTGALSKFKVFSLERRAMCTELLARVKDYDHTAEIQKAANSVSRMLLYDIPNGTNLADKYILGSAEILRNLVTGIKSVFERDQSMNLATGKLAFERILKAAHLTMWQKDPFIQYPYVDGENRQIHTRRSAQANILVRDALLRMVALISQQLLFGVKPFILITQNLTLWTQVNSPTQLVKSLQQQADGHSTFKFTQSAIKKLGNEPLSMSVWNYNYSYMTHSQGRTDGNLVEIHMFTVKNGTLQYMSNIDWNFEVYIKMAKNESDGIELKGAACSLPNESRESIKDKCVSTTMLEAPIGRGVLSIDFNKELLNRIRVKIGYEDRPGYDDILSTPVLNTQKMEFPYHNENERFPSQIYIGIIPVSDDEVNYTMKLRINQCLILHENKWKSQSCHYLRLSYTNNLTFMVCQCSHLSLFSASFFLPPNTLVLSQDIILFTTITDNFYVTVVLAIVFIVFLPIFIWGRLNDVRDEVKTTVIILEDNYPGDRYPYVIAVYTSEVVSAGTSARVAIRIFGTHSYSKVHILESPYRKTLQKGSDDWFLVYCKMPLGQITEIVLWHDRRGKHYDWYCKKVVIYDLSRPGTAPAVFLVERWFLTTQNIEESQLVRVQVEKEAIIPNPIRSHLIFWLKEKHTFGSIFSKSPRSVFTRCQLAMMAFGLVLAAMFTSMMFYVEDIIGPADTAAFAYDADDFADSVLSGIASFVLSSVMVLFCFERSYRVKEAEELRQLQAMTEPRNEDAEINPPKKPVGKQILGIIYGLLARKFLRPIIFTPITTEEGLKKQKRLKAEKVWLVIAWISSTAVVIISVFFIQLYGLKWGPKKTQIWLFGFLLSISFGEIFLDPLKITLVALCVALLSQRSLEENFKFDVTLDKRKPYENVEWRLACSLRNRTKPWYKPPTSRDLDHWFRQREMKRSFRALICNTLVILLQVASLVLLIYCVRITTIFYQIRQTGEHFSESKIRGITDLNKIRNRTSFISYMTSTVLPNLHRLAWYNGKSLPVEGGEDEAASRSPNLTAGIKGFCIDYSSKLLSTVRLRQLRINPNWTSRVDPYFRQWYSTSQGMLHILSEDHSTYVPPVWVPKPKTKTEPKYTHVWRWSSEKAAQDGPFLGDTGLLLPGSGYLYDLHWTLDASLRRMVDVSADEWIDNRTRAVLVQFNLYCANTNLFTTVNIIVEHLASGVFTTRMSIEAAHLSFWYSESEQLLAVMVGIISIVLIINGIRCYYLLSRFGVRRYYSKWSGRIDSLLIVLGFFTVGFFLERLFYFFLYVDSMGGMARDVFFSLYTPFNLNYKAMVVAAFFSLSVAAFVGYHLYNYPIASIFRETVDASQFLLISMTIICLVYSYYLGILAFYGSVILNVESFYVLITFKDFKDAYENMDRVNVYIRYLGLALIVFIRFNVSTLIYYFGEKSNKSKGSRRNGLIALVYVYPKDTIGEKLEKRPRKNAERYSFASTIGPVDRLTSEQ